MSRKTNKKTKGLTATQRKRVMQFNLAIAHSRAEHSTISNWQTTHKGYGVPMDKEGR